MPRYSFQNFAAKSITALMFVLLIVAAVSGQAANNTGSITASIISKDVSLLENDSFTFQASVLCNNYNCLDIEIIPQVNGSFITSNSFLSTPVPMQICALNANESCNISWNIKAEKAGNYGILVRANNSQYIYASPAIAVRAELPYTAAIIIVSPQTIQKTLAFNITCSAATNTNEFLNLKLETRKISEQTFTDYSLPPAFLCAGNCSASGYSSISFSSLVTGLQNGDYTLRCNANNKLSDEINVSIKSGYLQLSANNISGNKTEQKQINAGVYCLGGYCGSVNISITYNNALLSSATPIKLISGASNSSCGILFSGNICNISSNIEIDFGNKTGSAQQFLVSASSDNSDTNSTSSNYYATGYAGKLKIELRHALSVNQSQNTTAIMNVSCESYCGNVSVSLNASINESFYCGLLQDNSCVNSKTVSYNTAGKIKISAAAYSSYTGTVETEFEVNVIEINATAGNPTNISGQENTTAAASINDQPAPIDDKAALDETSPEELVQSAREELNEDLERQEKEIIVKDLKETKATLEDMLKSKKYPLGSAKIISDSIISLASTLASLEKNEMNAKEARAKMDEVKSALNQFTGKATDSAQTQPQTNSSQQSNFMLLLIPVIIITITAIAVKKERNKFKAKKSKPVHAENLAQEENKEIENTDASISEQNDVLTFSYTAKQEDEIKMLPVSVKSISANTIKKVSKAKIEMNRRLRPITLDYIKRRSEKEKIKQLKNHLDSNYILFKSGKIGHADYESARQKISWEINKLREQLNGGIKNAV